MTTLDDAVCTGCGCACDDIRLTAGGGHIVRAENACPLGEAWFFAPHPADGPAAFLDGEPASLDDAVSRAAAILRSARYPLVCGLADSTCEAQRAAAALADRVGAVLDSTTSDSHGPAGLAFQGVGEVTCTLGEVKNRADLVVFWGTDPVRTLPRHAERYSVFARGLFTPEGRGSRTVVVVDVTETATAALADVFLTVRPGSDFEVLWTLRALVKGVEIDAPAEWRDLARRMKECQLGVIFFGGGLARTPGRHHNVEAAYSLVDDLNAFTRFYAKPMGAAGNPGGADNVLTWTTGYPFAVSLARGYPRFGPGEFGAAGVLARGEADAALIVARDPLGLFPPEHLARVRLVTVGPRRTPAAVSFVTATPGIHVGGTVYRMDDVTLPLRPALASPLPSEEAVLGAIEAALR